jgi:DNA-binding CsgD family transcriptional regulator
MEQATASARTRLAYIDNLRWLMIVLVVLVHVCVTYSGLGSWYYKEERVLDVASALIFFGFELFCQAFFMGFLFMLSGHFVPTAYDRKGWGRYLLDRLVRLGVPTLIFMFVLHPVTVLLRDGLAARQAGMQRFLSEYVRYVGSLSFLRETGPLWFALALLGFSILYGVVIALTSFSDDDKLYPAIKAGAAAYLLKDVGPQQLAEAIRAAAREEMHLHPEVTRRLLSGIAGGDAETGEEPLTPREQEILRCLGRGMSNKEIGVELFISEKTAKTHVSNILGKLGLQDRTQAALYAVKHRLV